jgi:hypothetical protein
MVFSERDSSGTTREVHEMHEAGDGAASPKGEAARPKNPPLFIIYFYINKTNSYV